MCATFRNATAYLVLDADLQHLPEDTTARDVFVKVITSVWRQRLWTLQELALTNNAYIQGKDCVFELNQLKKQLLKIIKEPGDILTRSEPIHCELIEALLTRFLSIQVT